MTPKKRRVPTMECPHCAEPLLARTSEAETALSRLIRFSCTECGFAAVAQLVILRQLNSSRCPNQAIHLPISNGNLQRLKKSGPRQANEDAPLAANDEGLPAAIDPMTG